MKFKHIKIRFSERQKASKIITPQTPRGALIRLPSWEGLGVG